MKFRTLISYGRANTFLAIAGLLLQLVGFCSDSWVLVELTEIPMCGGKIVEDLEAACWGTTFDPHEVARAGLWRICHSFPFGYMPLLYYPTQPYCSWFSDDLYPEESLVLPQALCKTALVLNIIGTILCGYADHTKNKDLQWTGSGVYILCGMSGLLAAYQYYMNVRKEFLVEYHLEDIAVTTHWGMHALIDGSALVILAGLLPKPKVMKRVSIV